MVQKLRRPHRCFGLLPNALIEFSSKLSKDGGKPSLSHIYISRFGYTISHPDGSTDWWDNTEDNLFSTTVKAALKSLEVRGYQIVASPIVSQSTPSEDDILNNTDPIDLNHEADKLTFNLYAYLFTRPWYQYNPDKFDPSNMSFYFGNVRLDGKADREISDNFPVLYRKHGKLFAVLPQIRQNEYYDPDHIYWSDSAYELVTNRFLGDSMEITAVEDIDKWYDTLTSICSEFESKCSTTMNIKKQLVDCYQSVFDSNDGSDAKMTELALLAFASETMENWFNHLCREKYLSVNPSSYPFDSAFSEMDDATRDRYISLINSYDWIDMVKQKAINSINKLHTQIHQRAVHDDTVKPDASTETSTYTEPSDDEPCDEMCDYDDAES